MSKLQKKPPVPHKRTSMALQNNAFTHFILLWANFAHPVRIRIPNRIRIQTKINADPDPHSTTLPVVSVELETVCRDIIIRTQACFNTILVEVADVEGAILTLHLPCLAKPLLEGDHLLHTHNLAVSGQYWSSLTYAYPKVSGLQIFFSNRKSAFTGLNFFGFADLPQMQQFADLRFADHICGFAIFGPNYFVRT